MKKLLPFLLFFSVIFLAESCTKPSTTAEVKYNSDVKNIMTNQCSSCHGSANGVGGFSLATYADVKQYGEAGSLLSRINSTSNPMPPSGLMSQENRDVIQNWVNGGYAE